MHKKYRLVMFDCDGTIANTDEMLVQTLNILCDEFRNGDRIPKDQIYYYSGPPMRDTLLKEFPHMDIEVILKEYSKVAHSLVEKTVTRYPHSYEVMKELKTRGYILGVVSNKSKNSMGQVIKHLGFEDLFEFYVVRDDVKNAKPDPECMFVGMNKANIVNKDEVIYIGDNVIDFEASDKAGIDCILCTWGPRVISNDVSCKYKIKDFNELLEILK